MLDTSYIFSYIDSIKTLVENAQARHFQKWPLLGVSGQAPEVGPIATTYNAELDTLKHWIDLRLQWLDANIPGNCTLIPVSKSDVSLKNALKYYPNPSNGMVQFKGEIWSESSIQLLIYDITGKIVHQQLLTNGNQNLSIEFSNRGVYYFKIVNQLGEIQRGKIVNI
jgi:hypothetical protein